MSWDLRVRVRLFLHRPVVCRFAGDVTRTSHADDDTAIFTEFALENDSMDCCERRSSQDESSDCSWHLSNNCEMLCRYRLNFHSTFNLAIVVIFVVTPKRIFFNFDLILNAIMNEKKRVQRKNACQLNDAHFVAHLFQLARTSCETEKKLKIPKIRYTQLKDIVQSSVVASVAI